MIQGASSIECSQRSSPMADAIQTAIASLQREKRSNDAVAEPIIMPNDQLQAALQEIEGAIGGLSNIPPTGIGSILYQNGAIFASPSPLPVLYGGVGTNNFGLGLGIVTSPSATGSLNKTPFPTTGIVVVDNTGAAFAPSLAYGVGFSAYNTVQTANVTGNGQQVTVVCDTVEFQTGSGYSNTTGIFTAPVTAKYFFQFQATYGPMAAAHTYSVTRFDTSDGRTFWGTFINPYNAQSGTVLPNGSCTSTCTALISLTAGQTVTPSFSVNGSSAPTTVGLSGNTANRPTRFTGYIIPGL